MQLSDHIRTLLRDHDCVIIPDFGGLIADYAPAQIHPVRHTLAPPTKRVAFNQSLTRNDGLLVDALSHALRISPAQARQLVAEAVARLRTELTTQQRTELTGIGIFRQAAGRGLEFEYTGTNNLLAASYGLPELVSRPVRATDALLARERQPTAPQLTITRRARRLWQSTAAAVVIGLAFSANYLFALHQDYLPAALRLNIGLENSAAVPAQKQLPTHQQATLTPRSADNGWAETKRSAAPAPVTLPSAVAPASSAMVVPAPSNPKPVAATPVPKPVPVTVALPTAKTAVAASKPVVVAPTKAAVPVTAAPAAEKATIKARTGRFFVIADVFNSLSKAQQRVAQLTKQGQEAQIILPSVTSRYYRVSVGNFTDKPTATAHLSQLRKYSSSSPWVLSY